MMKLNYKYEDLSLIISFLKFCLKNTINSLKHLLLPELDNDGYQ